MGNYRTEYNGLHVAWEDKPLITTVVKQVLSEYRMAFETAAHPGVDNLFLHRLVEFAKNENNVGYTGLYCYVFKAAAIGEIIKFTKPYRTIATQHNGGFMMIGVDMVFQDEAGNPYKPALIFFRQDDIAWVRILLDRNNLVPVESGYMMFAGRERQKSILYEQNPAVEGGTSLPNVQQPVSLTWAINAGELMFALLNRDADAIIRRENAIEELSVKEEDEPDSMIEHLATIRNNMAAQNEV